MPAAPAVFAIERDVVAAVAAHAGAGGVGEPDFAVGRSRDTVGQATLQGERHGQRGDHWLMISRRTCAARGSCDWPSQKIAFLRSSLSCSVLAILISASNAAASWRWEYTKRSESTRLNSSHITISYAVFCLKKKNKRISQHCCLSFICHASFIACVV